jgi:hypothetical protein
LSARTFCTETASIKRNSTVAGITAAPTTHIASLAITPIWPIARMDQVQAFLELASARELKECFHVAETTTLPDVKEGDLLTLNAVEYPILHVMEWTDRDVPCLQIILQEVKQ